MSYLDDFEVAWNGGPLLPERHQRTDERWNAIPKSLGAWDDRIHVPDPTKARAALAKKRLYNKQNKQYWEGLTAARCAPVIGERHD